MIAALSEIGGGNVCFPRACDGNFDIFCLKSLAAFEFAGAGQARDEPIVLPARVTLVAPLVSRAKSSPLNWVAFQSHRAAQLRPAKRRAGDDDGDRHAWARLSIDLDFQHASAHVRLDMGEQVFVRREAQGRRARVPLNVVETARFDSGESRDRPLLGLDRCRCHECLSNRSRRKGGRGARARRCKALFFMIGFSNKMRSQLVSLDSGKLWLP